LEADADGGAANADDYGANVPHGLTGCTSAVDRKYFVARLFEKMKN
jgi:hypothetical protein